MRFSNKGKPLKDRIISRQPTIIAAVAVIIYVGSMYAYSLLTPQESDSIQTVNPSRTVTEQQIP